MKDSALILEGGALRGVYTSGVLDVLMEEDIWFPKVVGISAGSLNAVSYVSRQPGRSVRINLEYVNDPRYMGMGHWLRKKSFFNFDFVFEDVFHRLIPFDYDTFEQSDVKLYAVACDCRTGRAVFLEKSEVGDFLEACRASSSMPILCSMTEINKKRLLDGGIAFPVPVPVELPFRCRKLVYVMTRHKEYRMTGTTSAMESIYRKKYSQYPELLERLYRIPERYNHRMEHLYKLEEEGKIFILRPGSPVTVSRTEKNVEKLKALYEQGREETKASLEALKEYLKK